MNEKLRLRARQNTGVVFSADRTEKRSTRYSSIARTLLMVTRADTATRLSCQPRVRRSRLPRNLPAPDRSAGWCMYQSPWYRTSLWASVSVLAGTYVRTVHGKSGGLLLCTEEHRTRLQGQDHRCCRELYTSGDYVMRWERTRLPQACCSDSTDNGFLIQLTRAFLHHLLHLICLRTKYRQ